MIVFKGRGEDIISKVRNHLNDKKVTYMFRDNERMPYRPSTQWEIETKIGLDSILDDNTLYVTQQVIVGEIEDKEYCVHQGDNLDINIWINVPIPVCVSIATKMGEVTDYTSHAPEPKEDGDGYVINATNIFALVEPGEYFLNLNCDSGNAGYPYLSSRKITVLESKTINLSQFGVLVIDIENKIPPSLPALIKDTFNKTYPELYDYFALSDSVPKNICVKLSETYYAPASTSGATVWYNSNWALNCPQDIDCITHEFAHIISHYDSAYPEWFNEGFADYCRYIYGVHPSGDNWLPPAWNPKLYYKTLYDGHNTRCKHQENVAFLVWMNEVYGAPRDIDIVLRIHQMIKQNIYTQTEWDEEIMWDEILGKSLDELWHEFTNANYVLDYGENYKRILSVLAPSRLKYHKFD